ncbi:MAG: tripartite tricarboxylate transporter TctB family protein [Hyphomicrobiaceae bacterium]|nr:tripartite tricarboxylate transporter TctB family protein [Hyphomicrobiaceae bacterium]
MQSNEPTDEASLVSVRTIEIGTALSLLAVSAIVIYECVRLGFGWEEGTGPQAGFFPFIVAVLLGIGSGYSLLQSVFFPSEEQNGSFVSVTGFKRILLVLVPLFVFILAIGYVGMYVAGAIFIMGFMVAFGKEPILKAIAVGVGVPLALFFMFEKWFLVPLPKGPLEAMLGF